MTPITWTEVKDSSSVVHFETPGQAVEGLYRGGTPSGTKGSLLYQVEDPDGQTQKFWETLVLREKLALVPQGDYVRIEYAGISGKTKKFTVKHRPA